MTITKPSKPVCKLDRLPPALEPWREEECWVVWRWELDAKGTKYTKVPYQAAHPKYKARSNRPSTWASYGVALAAYHNKEKNVDGIGLMLRNGKLAAIDLDKCRNAESTELTAWGQERIKEAATLGAYVEVTVSGTGLRVIGLGKGDKVHRKFNNMGDDGASSIEVYRGCERFITVSGWQVGKCDALPNIDGLIDATVEKYGERTDIGSTKRKQSVALDYDDLIKNGAEEPERSELFQSVVWHLANKKMSVGAITKLLKKYPDGIGAKYADRLYDEVNRSYKKWLKKNKEKQSQAEAVITRLNEQYCVVLEGGKTRVLTFTHEHGREVTHYLTFGDFRNLYLNELVIIGQRKGGSPITATAGDCWLEHAQRRQYLGGITFEPSQPAVIDGNKLNLWRGWGIKPMAGDWSLMQQHIKEVLAGEWEEHERYILNYAAWCVQNPGTPAEVALVFKGKEGTGRGVFARSLGRCFGQHFLHISSIKHLTGEFNAHLRDCCLLFADEAFWPGYKQHEGTLKRIITEPTLFIEPKGINGFLVKNTLVVIIASNEKWVVPASIDARRFVVLDVEQHYKQNSSWFKPLYRQLNEGGCAAMLHDLLKRDLDGWHPREIIRTAALREQQILSLDSLDPHKAWWFSLINEGILPGKARRRRVAGEVVKTDFNPRRATSKDLAEHARQTVPGLRFATDQGLWRTLQDNGCRRFNSDGRGWEFPSLLEARAKWLKQMPGHRWRDAHPIEDWQEREPWPRRLAAPYPGDAGEVPGGLSDGLAAKAAQACAGCCFKPGGATTG